MATIQDELVSLMTPYIEPICKSYRELHIAITKTLTIITEELMARTKKAETKAAETKTKKTTQKVVKPTEVAQKANPAVESLKELIALHPTASAKALKVMTTDDEVKALLDQYIDKGFGDDPIEIK